MIATNTIKATLENLSLNKHTLRITDREFIAFKVVTKEEISLLFDYIYQSLNFEFDDNKYIIIYNGCEATYIPIHNVTYKVESAGKPLL